MIKIPIKSILVVEPDLPSGSPSVQVRLAERLVNFDDLPVERAFEYDISPWLKVLPSHDDLAAGMPILWPEILQEHLTTGIKQRLEIEKRNFMRDINAYMAQKDFSDFSINNRELLRQRISHAWLLVGKSMRCIGLAH